MAAPPGPIHMHVAPQHTAAVQRPADLEGAPGPGRQKPKSGVAALKTDDGPTVMYRAAQAKRKNCSAEFISPTNINGRQCSRSRTFRFDGGTTAYAAADMPALRWPCSGQLHRKRAMIGRAWQGAGRVLDTWPRRQLRGSMAQCVLGKEQVSAKATPWRRMAASFSRRLAISWLSSGAAEPAVGAVLDEKAN